MTPGPIANRVARIEAGDDPQLIAELPSGYAILANQQPDALPGCCMLLPRLIDGVAPPHLDEMPRKPRGAFLGDFATLGDAVRRATGCERVNYLILCNQVPELHAHAVPRYATEDESKRLLDPFAAYDFAAARRADPATTDRDLLERLRAALAAITS